MPRPYSGDLRRRVIGVVETGASRREAAELFDIDPSSAVRWVRCWKETGRCEAKPRGGSTSHLDERAEVILKLIAEQPDLTLLEGVSELRKRGIRTSKSALSRFFHRHDITLKKSPAGLRTGASRRGAGAPTLDTRTKAA